MKKIFLAIQILLLLGFFSCKRDGTYDIGTSGHPSIITISPELGSSGNIVRIYGQGFSQTPGQNKVSFNGTEGKVISSSTTQIWAVVPGSGTTGDISVSVGSSSTTGPVFTYLEDGSDFTVTTIAGEAGVEGTQNGDAATALFHNPNGVSIDQKGNLYIVDRGNNCIRKITPLGIVSTFAGTATTKAGYADGSPGQFSVPWHAVMDQNDDLLLMENGGGRVRKITQGGVVSTLAGPLSGISNAGFADGTTMDALFNNARDIVCDKAGNIYVADEGNKRIRKISQDNSTVTTYAGGDSANLLPAPLALALDSAGDLFVSDSHRIKLVKPDGSVTNIAGSGSAGFVDGSPGSPLTATLGNVWGLSFLPDGRLVLSDDQNTIRLFTPGNGGDWSSGAIKTIAGTGGKSGYKDGTGTTALFYNPYGIATDSAGNIYVAEASNQLIRKISHL